VAATRAMDLNRRYGEELRARLLSNIKCFRRGLASVGLEPTGGLMPVQTLSFGPESKADAINRGLIRAGIRALVVPNPVGRGGSVALVITAMHRPHHLKRAVFALDQLIPAPAQFTAAVYR
jgi:7-keto-8-aminopelargonate synthetase-like enzyme